jgi:hypothetical protein
VQHNGVTIVAKFLLTYHNPEFTGLQPTQEQRDASMAKWQAWFGQIGSALVDGGQPVGETKTVGSNGSASNGGSNRVTGYSIINVNSIDEAVKASGMCPVLADGGSVEVSQLLDVM